VDADRWATFDCYGTLIDWNSGMGRELERLFGAARGGELLHAYHELARRPAVVAAMRANEWPVWNDAPAR